MKLFELRHPEKGTLAEGVEWSNGRIALKVGASSMTSYLTIEDVIRVFLADNPDHKGTEVAWL